MLDSFFFAQQLYMSSCFFSFLLMDLIWLKLLCNSCTVRYLLNLIQVCLWVAGWGARPGWWRWWLHHPWDSEIHHQYRPAPPPGNKLTHWLSGGSGVKRVYQQCDVGSPGQVQTGLPGQLRSAHPVLTQAKYVNMRFQCRSQSKILKPGTSEPNNWCNFLFEYFLLPPIVLSE